MVSPKAVSRLASARNIAEQAGLNQTAERLELLRKKLTRFKDLPAIQRASEASWAIAKVDETKENLAREVQTPKEILKDRQLGHDSTAILTKIVLCASTMFSGLIIGLRNPEHLERLQAGGGEGDARGCAEQREHEALDRELPGEPALPRAKGGPDRHFPRAGCRAPPAIRAGRRHQGGAGFPRPPPRRTGPRPAPAARRSPARRCAPTAGGGTARRRRRSSAATATRAARGRVRARRWPCRH